MKTEKLPALLTGMEKLLKAQGGKHFAGTGLKCADNVVYQVITSLKRARPTKPEILIEESDITDAQRSAPSWQRSAACLISRSGRRRCRSQNPVQFYKDVMPVDKQVDDIQGANKKGPKGPRWSAIA